MGTRVDQLGEVLFDASLSATALLCLIALALVGCRQPVRRVHLARVVLACSLALLPLAALSPLPRIPVVRILHSAVGSGDAGVQSGDDESPATEPVHPARWAHLTVRVPADAASVLVPVYAAGVALGLGWLLLGYCGLGWLRRTARVPSPDTIALYQALPWGRRRARPRLCVSDRVDRPVLVGALRPTILIPVPLDGPDTAEALRLSLLHELAHAESWDPLFSMIGRVAQVFWFFLPPAWWIRAQMALDHEFLADRRAALRFGHLPSYASSLLGLAAPASTAGEAPTAPAGNRALTGSALVQRVLMLVQCPFPVESRPPAWWVWLLPALLVSVTLAAATLRVRISDAQPAPAGPIPSVRAGQPTTFRLSRLTVPPKAAGPHGRAPLFELPIRLPAAFDLTVQVWATPSTLADTRVVGLRLGKPADRLKGFATPPSWHLVHIHRDAGRGTVTLQIDDRPAPLDSDKAVPTAWLSVEPAPNQEGQFQHLRLSW